MDFTDHATDAARMGIVCAAFAILFASIAGMAFTVRRWFYAADLREGQTVYMKALADAYIMEQQGDVSGNDIVEFILKNDSRYDYYIVADGITYKITKAVAEELLLSSPKVCLWSGDYLLREVFTGDRIYDFYRVVPERTNDDTDAYWFYQIE